MSDVLERFPSIQGEEEIWDQKNPAIRLFGRRFYKDQVPLEYLAEFLLVFSSPKSRDGTGAYEFRFEPDENGKPCYYPAKRVPLKLFSFFPSSKLETRHPVHRRAYLDSLEIVKSAFSGQATNSQKEEAVRLLQNLLAGFVGIGKNRTWVTFSFLPAATSLLGKEVTWEHPRAVKGEKGEVIDWESSNEYFDPNTRNFFGRGGELLFMQLLNLFSEPEAPELVALTKMDSYRHLQNLVVSDLKLKIEASLKQILDDAVKQLESVINLIEGLLDRYNISAKTDSSRTALAWVPKISRVEGLFFAVELENICASAMSPLEKIDFIQTLCTLHVMRSLCFQARRVDEQFNRTVGFVGNYAWIACDAESESGTAARRMAEDSNVKIEGMLYRAVRSTTLSKNGLSFTTKQYQNADDNALKHFRRFGKEVGLVVPKRGPGQRFVVTAGLLRFFVTALLRPDESLRLNEFYNRLFAHYGIAIGGDPLATAVDWSSGSSGEKSYGLDVSTGWVEEALQQGGFLIELSDAVSIVHNPGGGEVRA
ncbi:MAG: hypothetical protein GVY22_02465 [Gammaproteobacteria bacterium]|jgi:hypothetical protein|nr:hypothetical protein [Gammaproteobacteria bacterium]